ncbi:MAG: hypothetical protein WDN30_08125 [Pararobbsia sp.]
MRSTVRLLLVGLLVVGVVPSLRAQEYCKDFGFLDKSASVVNEFIYKRMQSVLASDREGTVQQDQQSATNAGISIPVQGVLLGLTFAGSSAHKDYRSWKDQFIASSFAEVAYQLQAAGASSMFSDNAATVVGECLESGSPYGYFDVQDGANGKTFIFNFSPGNIQEKIYSTTIASMSPVSCDTTNPFSINTGSYLDLTGRGTKAQFGCTRTDPQLPLLVTLILDKEGHRTFMLPSASSAPALPPTVPTPLVPKRLVFVFSTYDKEPLPHVDPMRLSMKQAIAISTPPDMDCRVEDKMGSWLNGRSGPNLCPDLKFTPGDAGKTGVLGNDFDHNGYGDNYGVCSYAYSCLPNK